MASESVMPTEEVTLERRLVPYWLATLDANEIADAARRADLIAYQSECAHVLAAHFLDTVEGRRRLYAVVPKPLLRDVATPRSRSRGRC